MSPLTSTQIDEMTRVLPALGRLVQNQGTLSPEHLVLLLTGVKLNTNPDALDELRDWADVLERVHHSPTPDIRAAAKEALTLRALPEASVLLALDLAAQGQSAAEENVVQLSLGAVPPGQTARGQIDARNGPGVIVCESDQVRIAPRSFGREPTPIQVEADAPPGQVLWTTIKLITTSATTTIRLIAEWRELKETASGAVFVIASDGSGTHRTLAECVESAEPGATIHLQRGVHRLDQSAKISQTLTLVGEDRDSVEIATARGGCVLDLSSGRLELRDVTLRWTGPEAGDVVRVQSSEVAIKHCRFENAVASPDGEHGCGLWLGGEAIGSIEESEFSRNGVGIHITEDAHPRLERNLCRANAIGIKYSDLAHGDAIANRCEENQDAGIWVAGDAAPEVQRNECARNAWGIVFADRSSGTAHGNRVVENHLAGIRVLDQAYPILEENECGENVWGIAYADCGGGQARANQCTANHLAGIEVNAQAQPWLEANCCARNGVGIFYTARAEGVARGNQCLQNRRTGIAVGGQAHPDLEDNLCLNNAIGIEFAGTSQGVARRNQCAENSSCGVEVGEQATPLLEENACHGNRWGISYSGKSGGLARSNDCHANGARDWFVADTAQPHGVKDA
jgi:parallel beta-helix repeat protein